MCALNFIAGSHAAGAGDAGCIVEGEKRVRVVPHGSALAARPIGIPHSIHAAGERQLAQWARHLASFRLFRHIEFDDVMAMPPEPIALGADDHIGSDWSRAGGRSSGLPLNFADTESAGAEGGELMRDAEAGDRNPGLLRCLVNRVTRFRDHRLAVDIELHRSLFTVYQAERRQVIKSSSRKTLPLLRPDDIQTFRLSDTSRIHSENVQSPSTQGMGTPP